MSTFSPLRVSLRCVTCLQSQCFKFILNSIVVNCGVSAMMSSISEAPLTHLVGIFELFSPCGAIASFRRDCSSGRGFYFPCALFCFCLMMALLRSYYSHGAFRRTLVYLLPTALVVRTCASLKKYLISNAFLLGIPERVFYVF